MEHIFNFIKKSERTEEFYFELYRMLENEIMARVVLRP
jgi:hypothetical protein